MLKSVQVVVPKKFVKANGGRVFECGVRGQGLAATSYLILTIEFKCKIIPNTLLVKMLKKLEIQLSYGIILIFMYFYISI